MRKRRLTGDGGESGGHDGGGSLRWLLTYADMITLLMAFFIMMYSMSILNLNKFRQVAISIRSGFGGLAEGQGRSILGTSGQLSIRPSPITGESTGVPFAVVQKIQKLVKEKNLQNSVRLGQDERGLVVTLVTDKVLFARGEADLTTTSESLITSIAGAMKDVPNAIRVEGHTCDLPIVSPRYPSNWELSTARATTVVKCLIEEAGLSPDRLSAAGYADVKPIAPNTSEKNRAMNRRVDIVILKDGQS